MHHDTTSMSTKNIEEDNYTRITLRIPKALHAELSERAAEKSHSMNAEIIGRLQDSFADRDVVQSLTDNLVDATATGWRDPQEADKKRDDAVYGVLVKVADAFSAGTRSVENERNIMADVIKLMAKLRDRYYWCK